MDYGPLPRRDAILDLLSSQTRALHVREIAARLHVEQGSFPGLVRLLDHMAGQGTVAPLEGQRFQVGKKGPKSEGAEREGVLSANPRAFGFVSSPGHDDDLFVPREALRGAMHGDRVIARFVSRSSRGSEGEIVRVVDRANARVAGVVRRRGRSTWLEPDDARLRGPIVLESTDRAKDGEAAVARITRFPETPDENPEGELDVVLGQPGDPNVEVAKVLAREQIDELHPVDAVQEAERFGGEVSADALVGREDLTGIPLPTIDPDDARDHDDAVWARREPDGSYTAWIAIADVSHYVRPGTALDASSLARGCSIYLPDRAIPMLPRALSSTLCSLLPNVVRLCLCVEAKLDATGVVTSSRVIEGYMRSAAKLTYGGVARALKLTDAPPRSAEAEAMVDDLRVLQELSLLLRAHRMRRGALDFDLPEPKVQLDPATGAPIAVERRAEDPGVRKAYQLIEELMLLANELVARFLSERGVPTIYRVHGSPDETKLDRFAKMCGQLGLAFDIDDARDPKRLSTFLKKVARHPSRRVVDMLLLRAMRQAIYDTANIGHFGLASGAYLHFTSPIRRYPDLVVHRAVRRLVRAERIDKSATALSDLKTAAIAASQRERAAMDVEREVVDLYRALYMRAHIGETFEGTVTGLVGTGVFVQLDSPFVDVLVKMEDLGTDRYEVDEDGLRVVGIRSGDAVALGDRMTVTVLDVALLRRSVYGKRVVPEGTLDERRGRGTPARSAPARGAPTRGPKKREAAPARGAAGAKPSAKTSAKPKKKKPTRR